MHAKKLTLSIIFDISKSVNSAIVEVVHNVNYVV